MSGAGWQAQAEAAWKLAAGAAALGLVTALISVAAAGPWQGGQRHAERIWAAHQDGLIRAALAPQPSYGPPAPLVLTGLGPGQPQTTGSGVPLPTPKGLDEALSPLFGDSALGALRTGAVLDVGDREAALRHGAPARRPCRPPPRRSPPRSPPWRAAAPTTASPPPSCPAPARGTIVLVGGGDPTLTAEPVPAGADPQATPASLSTLAAATAKTLRERGTRTVSLAYDTSRYTGPVLHPIGFNDNVAPVTALMADEGRIDPYSAEDAPRYADPAGAAARTFAALLRKRGITVRSVRPGTAPQDQEAQIAEVDSMPLSALVERMLTNSDNDIAEALSRQVAIGTGRPVTFAGAGQAVRIGAGQAPTAAGRDQLPRRQRPGPRRPAHRRPAVPAAGDRRAARPTPNCGRPQRPARRRLHRDTVRPVPRPEDTRRPAATPRTRRGSSGPRPAP